MLNKNQFQGLFDDLGFGTPDEGGFSVDPHTGQRPSRGFMVSRAGSEQKVTAAEGAEGLRRYVVGNRKAWRNPGNYFGGWREPGSPTADLDTSINVHGPDALTSAADLGLAHDQRGIYDIEWNNGKGRSLVRDDKGSYRPMT